MNVTSDPREASTWPPRVLGDLRHAGVLGTALLLLLLSGCGGSSASTPTPTPPARDWGHLVWNQGAWR